MQMFWKQKYRFSLRGLLTVLLVLFGMIPMMVGSKMLIASMQQKQIDDRMIEVQNQCRILSNKMTRTGYLLGDSLDAALSSEIETMADVYNGRIVLVNKDYRIVQDTFHMAENRIHIAEEVIRCFQGENSSKYNREKNYFAQTIPVYDNTQEKGIEGVLVMTASTESMVSLTQNLEDTAWFFQAIVLLLLICAAVMVTPLLLNPFRELQGKLNHVAQGAYDLDIGVDTYRETRDISDAVDRVISDLKAVDQSRQEFVSNVSHELKTPITSIRVLADSLMGMGDGVPIELYREFMEDISAEVDRESAIINDLLTLVKMDKSEAELNVSQVDVNGLVKQILKRLRPIANQRRIELIYESIRDVTADADEMKLSLAITNLVENAIKYNEPEGWVRVTVDADHKFCYIKVADSGIGIPEELQDKIFDRFYRVDKARSRATGGSGLGLAITRNIVLMHKGAIKLMSKEGEGSTFTLRIPLNYIM